MTTPLCMREQYILQPTESSPGTGNTSPQRQRMAVWSGNIQVAGSLQDCHNVQEFKRFPVEKTLEEVTVIGIFQIKRCFCCN